MQHNYSLKKNLTFRVFSYLSLFLVLLSFSTPGFGQTPCETLTCNIPNNTTLTVGATCSQTISCPGIDGFTVSNGATLIIKTGATVIVNGNGFFNNGATVLIEPGATLIINGDLYNKNNGTGITVDGLLYISGNLFNANGQTGGSGTGIGGSGTIRTGGTITGPGDLPTVPRCDENNQNCTSGPPPCLTNTISIAESNVCTGGRPGTMTGNTHNIAGVQYVWQMNSGSGFVNAPGVNNTASYTYPVEAPGLQVNTFFRRTVTAVVNNVSCTNSNAILLITVRGTSGEIGNSQVVCNGTTPAPLVNIAEATGNTGGYQWQQSVDNGATWTNIANATGAGYAPGALFVTTLFRRNAVGTACQSNVVTITVNPGAVFSYTKTFFCRTDPNPAPVVGLNSTLGTFTWTTNGTGQLALDPETGLINLMGSNEGTYTITNTVVNGVNDNCRITFPQTITISSADVRAGTITPTLSTICSGNTVNLLLENEVGAIQWQERINGVWTNISGATATTFRTPVLTNNSLPAISKFYRVVVSGCGTAESTPVEIVVNPGPAITLGANPSVCTGATSVNLTYSNPLGSPTRYSISRTGANTGNWFNDITDLQLGSSPIAIGMSANTPAGIYTFELSVKTEANCVSQSYPFTVTVNSRPTIELPGIQPVCFRAGQFVLNFENNTATSYSLTSTLFATNPVNGTFPANGAAPIISFPQDRAAGTYPVTMTLGNSAGCTSTQQYTFDVVVKPAVTMERSPISPVCRGNTSFTISYTSTNATSYSIVAKNNGGMPGFVTIPNTPITGNPILVTGVPPTTPAGTYRFELRLNDPTRSDDCSTVSDFDVVVVENPSITTGAIPSVCVGATAFSVPFTAANLSAPNRYTITAGTRAMPNFDYSLVTNTALGTSPLSVSMPEGTPDGTYDFNITVTTSNNCVSASRTFSVVVNANPVKPTIAITGSTTLCQGESVRLTASPATSYLWSTGATTQFIDVSTAGSYTVQVGNASGCSSVSSDAVAVVVNPIPNKPVITVSRSTTLCQGEIVILSAPESASYLWSTGAVTRSIEVSAAGSYTVRVGWNTNSCLSVSSDAVPVVVNANPAKPTISITGSTTLCQGESVRLTASTATSYLWSTGATTQFIDVSTAGSYTVQVRNASGCSSVSSDAVAVVVNPIPSVASTLNGIGCVRTNGQNVHVTLSATGGVNGEYRWYEADGSAVRNAVNTGPLTSSSLTVNINSSRDYLVSIVKNNCESPRVIVRAFVREIPALEITGPREVCQAGTISLSVTEITGLTYVWSGPDGFTFSGRILTRNNATVAMSGQYTVTVSAVNGAEGPCTVPFSTNVTVNPQTNGGNVTLSTSTLSNVTVCQNSGNVDLTLRNSVGTVQRWESSPTGAANTWSTLATTSATTFSVPSATSGTTYYRAVLKSGVCSEVVSTSTEVIVNPSTVAGSTTGGTTVCQNSPAVRIILGGHIGNVVRWESSANSASGPWTQVANTNTFIDVPTDASGTFHFRAVVKSGTCAEITSSVSSIVVSPTPAVGAATFDRSVICPGESFVINHPNSVGPITWEVSTNGGTDYSLLEGIQSAGRFNTKVFNNSSQERNLIKIKATATNPSCTSSEPVIFDVIVNPTGGWVGRNSSNWDNVGNWCGGIPTTSTNVHIYGTTPSRSPIISSNVAADNISMYTGASLTIIDLGVLNIHGRFVSVNNNNFTAEGGTVRYASTSDGQEVAALNYQSLNISSGSKTFVGNISIAREFIVGAQTHTLNNNTITFNGRNQTIPAFTFYGLEINVIPQALGGVGNITLAGPVRVNNSLTLTAGRLVTGNNTLTLGVDAFTNIASNTNTANYVVGQITKLMAHGRSFYFPIGTAERFMPVNVINTNYSLRTEVYPWTGGYLGTNSDALKPINDPTIRAISEFDSWDIECVHTSGTVSAQVGISWGDHSMVSPVAEDRKFLQVLMLEDGKWENLRFENPNGQEATFGMVTSELSASFSKKKFTLGSTIRPNPLPIVLKSFTAKATATEVELDWVTSSEKNNEFFTIERSRDGVNFEAIAYVDGAGNSHTELKYKAIDSKPLYGLSYYRLKQTDFDGKFEYSKVETVKFNGGRKDGIEIYPNPSKGERSVVVMNGLKELKATIIITDMFGRSIFAEDILIEDHTQEFRLDAATRLPNGLYIVTVKTIDKVYQQKLIIKK
jgi:hypothetical protein